MSHRISPTAHYTGQVWIQHDLSDPELGTPLGRVLHHVIHPMEGVVARFVDGLTLERYLLDRHLTLDRLLGEAIEERGVRQVVEVAAGLSPRGYRFARRYRDLGLRYLEGDLPAMAHRKRVTLRRAGLQPTNHRVVDLDVLAPTGPTCLEATLEAELDPSLPTALLAEGLLSYFDEETMAALWPRLAAALRAYPSAVLLANTELAGEASRWPAIRAFRVALSLFAAAPVRLHFHDEADAKATLTRCGFDRVVVHRPSEVLGPRIGPEVVRILAAHIEPDV